MAKHTPATPLPWDFAILGNARAYVVHGDGEMKGEVIAPLYETGANQDDDAAYIAHAANAYPKLVEALRTIGMIPFQSPDVFEAVSFKAGFDAAANAAHLNARALLRELGED